jgi:hypothetical protein
VSTVLLSGVGELGAWALEFLARTPGVERIVSLKRGPWPGVSRPVLAMLGSTIQGHTPVFEHHQIDLADRDLVVRLLTETRPDVILHSATVRSPRAMMTASLDRSRRAAVRAAGFGMWLPWHLLPAARLTEAIDAAGLDIPVVNAAFPDVVNPALWSAFGHGPAAGAGNVEVGAARVLRYAMEATGVPADDVEVSLVGSHALFVYGPSAGVPHHFRLRVARDDVTADHDLDAIFATWPEPIDWRAVDVFSPFAASAVKNAIGLLGETPMRTHVTGPMGLPGGFPATIGEGRIVLDLPHDLPLAEAVAINERAARWDGIDRIDAGAVVYTGEAQAAMAELGYRCEAVTVDELPQLSDRLDDLYRRLITEEGSHAGIRP